MYRTTGGAYKVEINDFDSSDNNRTKSNAVAEMIYMERKKNQGHTKHVTRA